MRWPTGSDVTAIRQREKCYSRFYLGVQRGKTRTSGCGVHAGAGTVYVGCHYQLGNTDTYDANEHSLTFGTVGILAATDIRPGMTLAVGTQDDPFLYGSARIRNVDVAADVIYLEPNNLSAEGYLIAGDYIWVDGIYRLYRILPYIVAGVVYEDGNPDTILGAAGIPGYGIAFAANYLDRPIALMGSPRFAWTGEAINFYGWCSHGRGGNAINAHAWDFDGGTAGGAGAAAAGTPAAPVTARWNTAGEYVASLTVTDSSGKAGNDAYGVAFTQHVAVRPVLVYDRPGGDNPPYSEFTFKNLRGSYGSGWTASFEVFGTADKSEFPDNALVILFCEDWYGGVRGSRGGWYGQEGILFCGYIQADTVQVDSEKSSVSFEARTIEQWMKDIDCWPINFESTAGAPTAWHEFQAMACEDTLWYLAEFRSTLKPVTDCFFCSDPDGAKALGFLDITEASLYDQMSDQVGSCFFGQLSASRHGSVHLSKHKNMMDLVERTLWGPPIWVFSKQDWRDELEVGDERMRDSVAQVDFIGFIYDTDGNPQEIYSLAPERQANFGRIEPVKGILLSGNTIAAAQPEANTLSGLYRAWKNIRFPHIRVPAKNNRFLEPATLDYFGVTLAASDTVRGYEWDAKEFLCTEVAYEIDQEKGYVIADITGEASTWGPDGVAGDYPQYEPNLPDENPPEYAATWPSDPPPWADGEDAPTEGSDAWEPAAGAWANDGGPGSVWKFFIYDDRLFAVCETGDANRGLWERTAPATWVHRGLGGAGEYDAWTWLGHVWIINVNDNSIYRTTTPENAASWTLDFTPPGTEVFDIKGCAATYGGWLYIGTVDTTASPDVVHFHRRGGAWTLDYLPQYTNPAGESMDAYDVVKYGRFWWSGWEQGTGYIFKYSTGAAFLNYTTNLQAGKFENCHAMYFTAAILDKVYRGTGGGWVEDYDFDGDSINYVDLSIDWTGDVVWVGAEIDAANIECHAKWWGEDWRSILPSCADTWGGGAIRGPDDHAYLGGSANIWRFVPA